jgi:hypothetical protein
MATAKRWKDFLALFLAAVLLAGLAGCSSDDSASSTSTIPDTLSAPEQVGIMAGDGSVTIQWSEVNGAVSYNLYRDTVPGVTKGSASAVKVAGVTSPHVDQPLTNGTTYYYVLTAVYAAGESPESPELSATPQVPAPDAPRNLTAILTPETTLSVTLQWEPPDPNTALSYNLYRGETAGFSADLATATATLGAISPHIDQVPVGGVTYYYTVTAVNAGGESLPSGEVSATPRGPQQPGVGDTGFGNNLSAPLIFADGIGMGGALLTGTWLDTSAGPVAYDPLLTPIDFNSGLRPLSTESFTEYPNLDPATAYVDPVDLTTLYYEQKTANSWQAEWRNGTAAPVHVTARWGDNLASVSYKTTSTIRVETGLDNIPETPMWQYPMTLLYGAQTTEMQGTTGIPEQVTLAQVYAVNARLKIEKLDGPGGNVVATFFDKAVWEGFGVDGPGGYAGEINVAGKLTYGYVWSMRDVTTIQPEGWWRLTFSLDPTFQTSGVNNTIIDACTNCTGANLAQNEIWIELEITL